MTKRREKPAGRGLKPEELRAQEGLELPDRHAMSLLSGMPSLDGGGLMGAPAGGTTPTDPSATGTPASGPVAHDPGPATTPGPATDPGPTSGNLQTFAPVNKATVLNQLSNGASQGAGSTQTSPITQSS